MRQNSRAHSLIRSWRLRRTVVAVAAIAAVSVVVPTTIDVTAAGYTSTVSVRADSKVVTWSAPLIDLPWAPTAMAIDEPSRRLYVISEAKGQITYIDLDTHARGLLGYFVEPKELASDFDRNRMVLLTTSGIIVIPTNGGTNLSVLTPAGDICSGGGFNNLVVNSRNHFFYVTCTDSRRLQRFDLVTGDLVNEYTLGDLGLADAAGPSEYGEMILSPRAGGVAYRALNLETGVSKVVLHDSAYYSTLLVTGGRVVVSTGDIASGGLFLYDSSNHSLRARASDKADTPRGRPAGIGYDRLADTIWAVWGNGEAYEFNRATFDLVRKVNLRHDMATVPLAVDPKTNTVYSAMKDPSVAWVRVEND